MQTYDLGYADIKALSRNALAYSFLPGQNLFTDVAAVQRDKACKKDRPGTDLSTHCEAFLADNEKARLQWQLEQRFRAFEGGFRHELCARVSTLKGHRLDRQKPLAYR